ncbi:MAG: hypothetical protein BGO21_20775 [Dyadobacter sp. 50-39]|uniref:DUF2971 domain-containing protein n=1 Tax=Dyadobacter sp. 50-39 TaxID=1895756 RepID=UPI00095BA5E2|nr:DUF2971 domain-containing protein [Dyadobacter sp. 50-39]OJV19142.1 MAG: hypothetical protein BGO21_20775 [Dyadobacter sp. 50-39]
MQEDHYEHNPPEKGRLFKYLHSDRTDILRNQQIRFTPAKYLNDVFELSPEISSPKNLGSFFKESVFPQLLAEPLSDVAQTTIAQLAELIPGFNAECLHKIFEQVELDQVCASLEVLLDHPSWNDQGKKVLRQKLDRQIGVLSLTRSNDSGSMWSRYAEEHKGFVIEFDTHNPFLYNFDSSYAKFVYPTPIQYCEERPSFAAMDFAYLINPAGLASYFDEMIQKTVFVKGLEWQHEDETRVIRALRQAKKKISIGDQRIHLFGFESSLIKNIYLGYQCTPKTKSDVLAICREDRYKHVTVFKQQLPSLGYSFDFKQIRKGMGRPPLPLPLGDTAHIDPLTPIWIDLSQGGLLIGRAGAKRDVPIYQREQHGNPVYRGEMESYQFVLNAQASIRNREKLEQMNKDMFRIRKRFSLAFLIQRLSKSNDSTPVFYAVDERYEGARPAVRCILEDNQFYMNKYSSLYYFHELIALNATENAEIKEV